MHILFLTDNFPPEVNAPASRTFEHCREWVKTEHRVTVITCVPNFPQGQPYPGYKNKLWQTETIEGIRVIRVWSYITANSRFVRRILDYISYMISATIASIFVRKVDLVVGTSPQLFTAVAAYLVGFLKSKPYVFELRDLWPESIKAVGAMRDSKVIQVFELLELFLYRKAACIIPVTHSFKKVLVNRGIDANKIHVVTNGVDVSRYSPQIKDKKLISRFQLQDKFVVGYIGTHGMAHALETILKAAKLLSVKNDNDSIHFVLLGNGAKKVELMRLAEEMQLDNVTFFDSVLKDEVVRYWSLLDVSIIHLKRTPLFQSVIPSKLFESMGMGIPVLCGVEGESAEIVNRDKVGLTFIPEDETDLINKLTTLQTNTDLYQQFSNNCLAMAHVYDRTELANKMLNVLESINAENLTNHRLKKKIVEIDERLKVNLK